MAISIILLAYNEAENLKVLIPDIKKYMEAVPEPYEIIVIDTAQPMDNTAEVCNDYGVKYVNQRYRNFGGAFRTGIEEAVYDKFLILDSDGSHNPKYIPDMYNSFISGADMVIGSRYIKGGKTNDSLTSVFMSRILNFIYRIVIGVKAKDISTDFRLYDTKQLKNVKLTCENYDVLQEVIMQLKINNPKLIIKEIPIEFQKRMYGNSKRKLLLFILGYIKTVFKILKMRIQGANYGK